MSVVDTELYAKVKAEADEKYAKPSAYKSGWIVKTYKERGGTYRGKKTNKGLTRWYKEDWKDIGDGPYPLYRPTKRISKDTPTTEGELSASEIKKMDKLKQKIKGDKNLPKFGYPHNMYKDNNMVVAKTEEDHNRLEKLGYNHGGCCLGAGLNAKKIQHMTSSSYLKNKDIKGIGGYRLDKSLSTSEAKVFVNKDTGKVVVANRGTKPTLKDWTNNLSLLLGQYKNTQRYKNARNIQIEVLDKYPDYKVLNVGHSQGAAITKRLNEEGLTGEIININPAALPTDRKKKNETTIRSSGDIVSMYDRPKKGDVMIKSESFNPLAEHTPKIVERLDPKTYIGSGFSFWVEN